MKFLVTSCSFLQSAVDIFYQIKAKPLPLLVNGLSWCKYLYFILNNCAQILRNNFKSTYFTLKRDFFENVILDLLENALTDFFKISSTVSQSTKL